MGSERPVLRGEKYGIGQFQAYREVIFIERNPFLDGKSEHFHACSYQKLWLHVLSYSGLCKMYSEDLTRIFKLIPGLGFSSEKSFWTKKMPLLGKIT